MFGVVSVLLVLAPLADAIAILTGIATTFRELGMLYGMGGWPGRIAAIQGLIWLTALLYTGPPESDWAAVALAFTPFEGLPDGILVLVLPSHQRELPAPLASLMVVSASMKTSVGS